MRTTLLCVFAVFCFALAERSCASGEITRDEFSVRYSDDVPELAANLVADRVEAAIEVVRAYLAQAPSYSGPPYNWPIKVTIDPDRFGPYQSRNEIYLPEARVLNLFSGNDQARNDLGIVHEVTHVLAASYARKNRDRFYDDGLAVYLQHRFGSTPNYPNFGVDLYVAVASYADKYGAIIPLAEAEAARGNREDSLGRQLAYIQEGAFTQFLIENYGLDAYIEIYQGADLEEVTGHTFAELEAAWTAMFHAIPIR